MKFWNIILIATVLLAAPLRAELAPETAIEDYLPTINVGAMETGMEGGQWSWGYQGMTNDYDLGGTTWTLNNDLTWSGMGGMVTIEECVVDPDPTIFLSQVVYNNTASTKTYFLDIDQPAYFVSNPSTTYGSVAVSLLDDQGNGATLTDNETPIYQSFIDGNPAGALLSSTTLSTPPGTVDSTSDFFLGSYPGGVVSNISIHIEFTLSPGDSASVQSRFDVIPEPASTILIGFAASAIGFIRHRFRV